MHSYMFNVTRTAHFYVDDGRPAAGGAAVSRGVSALLLGTSTYLRPHSRPRHRTHTKHSLYRTFHSSLPAHLLAR